MIITTHYIEEASQADVVGFFFEREVGGFEIRCLSPLRLGRLDEKWGYLGSIVAAHSHGKTPIKSANRHSLSSSKSFFSFFSLQTLEEVFLKLCMDADRSFTETVIESSVRVKKENDSIISLAFEIR